MARLPTLRASVPTLKRQAVPELTTSGTLRTRGNTWARIRNAVLTRDMGLCQCEQCRTDGALTLATEVDHIRPLWEGGTDSMENLQAINSACHKAKTKAEAARRSGPT